MSNKGRHPQVVVGRPLPAENAARPASSTNSGVRRAEAPPAVSSAAVETEFFAGAAALIDSIPFGDAALLDSIPLDDDAHLSSVQPLDERASVIDSIPVGAQCESVLTEPPPENTALLDSVPDILLDDVITDESEAAAAESFLRAARNRVASVAPPRGAAPTMARVDNADIIGLWPLDAPLRPPSVDPLSPPAAWSPSRGAALPRREPVPRTDGQPLVDVGDLLASRLPMRASWDPHPQADPRLSDEPMDLAVSFGVEPPTEDIPPSSGSAARPVIEGYILDERLGIFEEGELWIAEAPAPLDCGVIVELLDAATTDAARRTRVLEEARLTKGLTHPYLTSVLDYGTYDGGTFVARALVNGQNLCDEIALAPMDLYPAVRLATQIADALDFAHSRTDATGNPLGLVHGALAPTSILIRPDGSPCLTRLSVAHLDDGALLAGAGARRGVLGYRAPEQDAGETYDARADLYALGMVLLDLIGDAPLSEDDRFDSAVVADIIADRCTAAAAPPGLLGLLLRTTSLDPARRPSSAHEVASLLRLVLDAFDAPTKARFMDANLDPPPRPPVASRDPSPIRRSRSVPPAWLGPDRAAPPPVEPDATFARDDSSEQFTADLGRVGQSPVRQSRQSDLRRTDVPEPAAS